MKLESNITLQYNLIKRCIEGDKRAEFALFKQYAKQMYNVAFRITGNNFEAEDVVQDAFVKAFNHLKSFKGNSHFGAWLKTIVINEAISIIRKRKHIFNDFIPENIKDVHSYESFEIAANETIETVMKAVQELPDGARIVFTLKAIEEYKFSEIAETLKLSVSNCKVQYHRSKKILQEKLKNKVFAD